MSSSDPSDLLERWRAGTLDQASCARLLAVLRDPAYGPQVAADLRIDQALADVAPAGLTGRVRRRWLPWAASAIAAAAAGLALALWAPWSQQAWHVDGHRLAVGETVGSPERSMTVVSDGGSRLVLEAGSRLELSADGIETRFRLLEGDVRCAAELPSGGRLTIATSRLQAEVHGTVFRVATGLDADAVSVEAGRVAVTAPGEAAVSVDAGGRRLVRDGLPDAAGPAWSDRRPIAIIRLWRGVPQPTNPRGMPYILDGVDIFGAEGSAMFRRRMCAAGRLLADELVGAGYQGVLLFHLEGRPPDGVQMPGDPSRLAELAPEVDAIIDDMLAPLRARGLAIGVVLRPERLIRDGQAPGGWRLDPAVDHAAELAVKAKEATKRFGARIFFVNSIALRPDASEGRRLSTRALAAVTAAAPAALVLAETPVGPDYGLAAGWHDLTGPARPIPGDLLARHPAALRICYWPDPQRDPPAIDSDHDILLREWPLPSTEQVDAAH